MIVKWGEEIFEGSADDIVKTMSQSQALGPETAREYMERVAKRVGWFREGSIRYDRAENFLRDLDKEGIVNLDEGLF